MSKEDFIDPYIDPSSGILYNLLNTTDDNYLKSAEADLVYAKELIIDEVNIPRTNDATELLSIHKFLFEDIYEWAGMVRRIDIAKHSSPQDFFLIQSRIETALSYVFKRLKNERYLTNLEKQDFADKLAYFYEQLNFIHPFREGNGRTQRVFWNRIAKDAGYKIEWDKVVGEENDAACHAAMKEQNLGPLINMFEKIVKPLE